MKNEMILEFNAISSNEGFARVAVAAFTSPLNPTLEEISDIKTAVSEAVTNAIIHGYGNTFGYKVQRPIGAKQTVPADETGKQAAGNSHRGEEDCQDKVLLHCRIEGDVLHILVQDQGCGIENVEKAMEPLYTTRPELERSGMGFAFMEAFMDDLEVESVPGKGTVVRMKKKLGSGPWIRGEE